MKETSDNMRTRGNREGDYNKNRFYYVIFISIVNKSLANHYICLIHVVKYFFLKKGLFYFKSCIHCL